MKRIAIAVVLAVLLMLAMPVAASAAGVTVVSRTGDGTWTNNTWQVEIYPGETKATTIKLYNSSSSSLGVEVTIFPESLDGGNLLFELDKSSFTMSRRSYADVTMSVKANGSATPGTYTAELYIKSEVAPSPPRAGVPPDTTPPIISGVLLYGVTETTADICWTTNERSTSQVKYWTSASRLSPLDEAYVLEHHIQLTDLTPDTTYYYTAMSMDKAGNLAVFDEYTFTTLEEVVEPEPIPPEPEEPTPPPPEEEPEVIEPEEPEEEEPEVVEPEEEEEVIPYVPPEKPGTPWALIGGVVGGLAAAGGIGYWLWRRRRKEISYG